MTLYNSNIPHTVSTLPPGVAGVRRTLQIMVRVARQARKDPGVRDVALNATRFLASKDYRAEAHAIFDWVKRNIRYVRDVHGVETIQTPQRTLSQGSGDCDDHSTLLAALLLSIGHPVRFVALGFKGGPYAHVICETKLGNLWVPLDTTVKDSFFGWTPPGVTRLMTAHI